MNPRLHKLFFSTLSCSLLLTTVSIAQTTERVSVDSLGTEGNGNNFGPSVSADGRYVAFSSYATNLVPGDTNATQDIFVHDRLTDVTERVSVDSLGIEGNGNNFGPSVSADGRYVAFGSEATNLVPGDNNATSDVFVHDRQTDVTERVSVDSLGTEGNNGSYTPSVSADGRYVAFGSYATNLVPGDNNATRDIFVHDRQTDVTERVSVDSFGVEGDSSSVWASISADGRYVAFQSAATNLVPGDTNLTADIFVHDRLTDVTERVSLDSLGAEGDSGSDTPSVSADGRYVAFSSSATNLVPGDTNATSDIFVHDRPTNLTERVSVDSLGTEGNSGSYRLSMSSDGRYVAFQSPATNLVPGDTNLTADIFVHDRLTDVTERVSADSLGTEGNNGSYNPSISADGRYVAFSSDATNLVPGDTNAKTDDFVHDRWDGLGANSIYLTGPSASLVSVPLNLSWQTTRGNSQYWLIYSSGRSGSVIRGHIFDLDNPTVLTSGTHAANGVGSFTSPPVPSGLVGSTIYFEVAARDSGGVIYDSNAHAVTFF